MRVLIIFICFIIVGSMKAIYTYIHLPKKCIDARMAKDIKKFGLIHFTTIKCAKSIVKTGLEPGHKLPMSCFEKNMVWMYINYPWNFDRNLAELRSKGVRKHSDAVVYFYGIEDNQIEKMRNKKNTDYIVHLGIFYSKKMKYRILDS